MSKIKGKTQKTVIFLWGIAGSGKTTYAESFKSHSYVKVIDGDKIYKKNPGDSLNLLIKEIVKACDNKSYKEIIVDSLLTTNDQARKIFNLLNKAASEYDLLYKIVYWKEDREACLHNDKDRRSQDSEITINNIPFEKPDCKILTELNSKRITAKTVVKKQFPSTVMVAANKLGFKHKKTKSYSLFQEYSIDGDVLKSREWSEGSYWSGSENSSSSCSPGDDQPEFEDFDKLLGELCPNITFLQYKKIYRQCCKLNHRQDSDYYGGYSKYAWYTCDLIKLEEVLKEMGYLSDII